MSELVMQGQTRLEIIQAIMPFTGISEIERLQDVWLNNQRPFKEGEVCRGEHLQESSTCLSCIGIVCPKQKEGKVREV